MGAQLYTRWVYPPSSTGRDEKEPAPQLGLFSGPSQPAGPTPEETRKERSLSAVTGTAPEGETRAAPDLQELRRRLSPLRRKTKVPDHRSNLPAWNLTPLTSEPGFPAPRQSPPQEAAGSGFPKEDEEEPAAEPRRIWTVGDLVGSVRAHIEQAWADLWVHGEISNLRTAPSGHLYFTLKDGESQLPAVLFRRQAQMLRFRPEDGLEVLLRGKVSVYEQRGQMQLIAEHLEPVGAGSLQIAFEQLKARLAGEGLFEESRKRALPPYPRCVGIVTSPAGAVIRDFLNVAGRRHAALDVLLYPAVMQGSAAAAEVAAGIEYFNRARNVDVIVIARGGGSLEDLAPFNSELLARAIAASSLPVVSAIGHETDFTIADFVADLRAPTPSAAAELITAAQHRVEERVAQLGERLARACRYQLILARQRLGAFPMQSVHARMTEGFNRREQRVDALRFRMEASLRMQLHAASSRVAQCSVSAAFAGVRAGIAERSRLAEGLHHRLESGHKQQLRGLRERLLALTARLMLQDARQLLSLRSQKWAALDARLRHVAFEQLRASGEQRQSLTRQLESLSPLAVLRRGYALVFDEQGSLVKRATDVIAGELLTLRVAEGTLRSRVEEEQRLETQTGDA